MMKIMLVVIIITPTSVKAGMLVGNDEDDDVDGHDDGNNHTHFSQGLYAAQRLARPFITQPR